MSKREQNREYERDQPSHKSAKIADNGTINDECDESSSPVLLPNSSASTQSAIHDIKSDLGEYYEASPILLPNSNSSRINIPQADAIDKNCSVNETDDTDRSDFFSSPFKIANSSLSEENLVYDDYDILDSQEIITTFSDDLPFANNSVRSNHSIDSMNPSDLDLNYEDVQPFDLQEALNDVEDYDEILSRQLFTYFELNDKGI